MSDLTPELIKRAEKELGETEEVRFLGIKELKRLIKEEPDFNPWTDDAFLTRFLRARKYDVNRAFKTLKNFYLYKAQNSGVLTDLRPSDFTEGSDIFVGYPLELRDYNQCLVGLLRLGLLDTDRFHPDRILAYCLLASDILLSSEATQVAGYCLILDFAGFSLRKAKSFASPRFLYKAVSAIQDCYPSRIKAVHIVNEPVYIGLIFNILKTFLSEKLKKRLYFHGNNLESLHKHTSPDILPEELGGTQGPAIIRQQKYYEYIQENEEYFVEFQKYGYTGMTLQKLSKDNSNLVL